MGDQAAARAASLASSAAAGAGSNVGEIHDVNERIDRLVLVVDALWSLLRDTGWTDDQLKARIEEIDAADGTIDGRRTAKPNPCGGCGSMVEVGRPTCAFCGVAVTPGPNPTDHI